jgi:hypothetical protein
LIPDYNHLLVRYIAFFYSLFQKILVCILILYNMSYPPADVIAAAARFYDGARAGDVELFEKFLPIGLRANMTNEKGDTLVSLSY